MQSAVSMPNHGDAVLPWARSATSAINALYTFAPSRGLVRSGMGSSIEPLPENKRKGKGSTTATPGCWELKIDDEDGTAYLDNCYLLLGDTIVDASGNYDVDAMVRSGRRFVAVKVAATGSERFGLVGYASLEAMAADSRLHPEYAIVPLYEFEQGVVEVEGEEDGEEEEQEYSAPVVKCDLRNMPLVQKVEVMQ